jgi:hypothetical protein
MARQQAPSLNGFVFHVLVKHEPVLVKHEPVRLTYVVDLGF